MFPALAQTGTLQSLHQQNDMTIAGTVASAAGKHFTLSNGSGEIKVKVGSRWYKPITVSPGEQLIVAGSLKEDGVDAYRITRANGEVITLGNGLSRLPWMGRAQP